MLISDCLSFRRDQAALAWTGEGGKEGEIPADDGGVVVGRIGILEGLVGEIVQGMDRVAGVEWVGERGGCIKEINSSSLSMGLRGMGEIWANNFIGSLLYTESLYVL